MYEGIIVGILKDTSQSRFLRYDKNDAENKTLISQTQ